MFAESIQPTLGKTMVNAMLSALSARPAAALLDTPTLHLTTGAFSPTPTDDPTTYTEANFSGYGAATVTFAGPVNLLNLVDGVVANANFISTTATPFVSNNITGYYLTNGAGTVLYMAEVFPTPMPIAVAGDFLNLEIALPLPLRQAAQ